MKKKSNSKEKELIKKLKYYIRANASKFLKDENISSVGVGYKIKDGKRTNQVCIQFTVSQKVELESLESIDSMEIPKKIKVEDEYVPTDIIQRSYDLAFEVIEDIAENARKTKADPLFPGVSISNEKGTAGTLGCIVYDKNDNMPFMLSNWHVLHGDNGNIGDSIVQPGPYDDNRLNQNRAGTLVRSYLGHAGDCAIATIEGRGYSEEICDLQTKVAKLCEPELGDILIKSGRTTNVTYGVVVRTNVIIKIYYGKSTGEKEIGCFEIGVDEDNPPQNGEISMGGDSGAIWLLFQDGMATNIMAGLHFAGESSADQYEHALACYPKSVFEKLGIKASHTEDISEVSQIGYNEKFLSKKVEVPKLENPDIALLVDDKTKIDYTHFSLTLHKERKFAIWVFWNIDGGKIKKVKRRGFKLDKRIPGEYQIGNELYKYNNLDRGHIARRADLAWGTLEEAEQANRDSSYYTNIAPQMDGFNQSSQGGIWGGLENAVFDEVDIDDLKISVIGGPVFHEDDRIYRNEKIPTEFYKVIVYQDSGEIKAKGFILTQNLNRLEILDLEQYKVYEVPLSEIEERCHFKFDATMYTPQIEEISESAPEPNQILRLEDVNW